MKKPTVLLTRQLPETCMERLQEESDIEFYPHQTPMPREELLNQVQGKDAIIALGQDRIDAEFMEAARGIKVISNYAVGYNNVDVTEATRRKIPVTNTPGVVTEPTADLAWALLFGLARRVVEADQFVRSGKWKGFGPLQFLGQDISGKTLGLIGLGRIGKAMIPRAKGFGMHILYWNRTRLSEEAEQSLGITYASKEQLLRQADYISLHVALTEGTRHLIDREALELMRPDSYLINTTRGPVVDEGALVEALQAGRIAGAGLDVFENEPEVHPGLIGMENVVLLPHLGSATLQVRTQMGMLAIDNCLSACRGMRPLYVVNPEIYE